MPRRTLLSSWWLPALAIAASVAKLSAQTPQAGSCEGQVVASVKLVVDGHPEFPQTLTAGLDVRPQMTFTREAYRRSFERLIRLGSFEKVFVACSVGPSGADITFRAEPYHPVTIMLFEGTTGLSAAALDEQVRQRYNGYPNIAPDLVNQEVTNILSENGYKQAKSEVRRETFSNPDRATLTFVIDAGPLAEIGTVTVEGLDVAAMPLEKFLELTDLIKGRPFRSGPIGEAILRAVNQLKSKGYYTAAFLGLEEQPAPDNTYNIKVTLDTGPHVTIEWDTTGDTPPNGTIEEYFPLKEQNTVDRDLLDDSTKRVENVLRNEGYTDAKVEVLGTPTDTRWEIKVRVTRGPKYRISAIEFPPNLHIPKKDLMAWLPVHPGNARNEAKIYGGLSRIVAEYRLRGYYNVDVTAKYLEAPNRPKTSKEAWVVLRPEIVEGPKGTIVDVRFVRSAQAVSETDLLAAMGGVKGQPYIRAMDVLDRQSLETLYLNRGYRAAAVGIAKTTSDDGTQVTRVVTIEEGPQVIVADVQIVGWRDISEKAIREEVLLREGLPFGEEARLESQRRVYQMGVFRRVEVDAEAPLKAGETSAHVIVRVQEAPDTTVSFGGGLEAGSKTRTADTIGGRESRIEVAPRGFIELTRRNLGGRNRSASVFGRLSLTPRDAPGDPIRDGRGYGLSQYRVALAYQEHRAFGTDTDWLFGVASEQAIRATFNFRRVGGNVDFTRLLSRRERATLRYAIDFNKLYNVQFESESLEIDRAFSQVRISGVAFSLLSDRRDDVISPSRGIFMTADTELAARALGSEVGFTKTLLQAATYRRLVPGGRAVLALRGEVGLARGFEREVTVEEGTPTLVAELPASVRFFAGGSTTVRGFQLDQLGTPAVLTLNGLSKGGNGLVVLNAELRTRIAKAFRRDLSAAVFMDAGNVFAKVSDMSFRALRPTAGYGFRYNSPIGPVRLDFGYKLNRITFANGQREGLWEFYLSFGEIF